jgi:hypothetical protein
MFFLSIFDYVSERRRNKFLKEWKEDMRGKERRENYL